MLVVNPAFRIIAMLGKVARLAYSLPQARFGTRLPLIQLRFSRVLTDDIASRRGERRGGLLSQEMSTFCFVLRNSNEG